MAITADKRLGGLMCRAEQSCKGFQDTFAAAKPFKSGLVSLAPATALFNMRHSMTTLTTNATWPGPTKKVAMSLSTNQSGS
jgi:hypothetical protein